MASPNDPRQFKKVWAEIEMAADTPEGRGEVRHANEEGPSPGAAPNSKRHKEIAGIAVCALSVIGGSLDEGENPYDEPDVLNGAFDTRDRAERGVRGASSCGVSLGEAGLWYKIAGTS